MLETSERSGAGGSGSACLARAPRPEPGWDTDGDARATMSAAATARPFPLVPRRRFLGVQLGESRSRRRGPGDEVAGSRPYRPGDRPAWIDWAASARLSAARGATSSWSANSSPSRRRASRSSCDRRPAMAIYPAAAALARQGRGGRGGDAPDHDERVRSPGRARARRPRRRSPALGRPGEHAPPVPAARTDDADGLRRRSSCSSGTAPSSPSARSCSSSRTSWRPFRAGSGRGCACCAGTSPRSSSRTRSGSSAFRASAGSRSRSSTRRPAGRPTSG